MTTYAVQAIVQDRTHNRLWTGTRQCPAFYLDSKVQGIVDIDHAKQVARQIVDPFDTAHSVHLSIEEVAP